ncbi:MAG: hypothetical protein WDM76_05515 [Limisphaerales bacterium]
MLILSQLDFLAVEKVFSTKSMALLQSGCQSSSFLTRAAELAACDCQLKTGSSNQLMIFFPKSRR